MQAISELDKSAGKGVFHANKAARLKSRLMKRLAALGSPVASSEKPAEKTAAPAKKTRTKKAEAK